MKTIRVKRHCYTYDFEVKDGINEHTHVLFFNAVQEKSPYVYLGEVEIDIPVPEHEKLIQTAVEALKVERAENYANFMQRDNEITEKIKDISALPAPSFEEGDEPLEFDDDIPF